MKLFGITLRVVCVVAFLALVGGLGRSHSPDPPVAKAVIVAFVPNDYTTQVPHLGVAPLDIEVAAASSVLRAPSGSHALNADLFGDANDLAEAGQRFERTARQRTPFNVTQDLTDASDSKSGWVGTVSTRWHDMASGTGIPIRV